LAILPVWIHTRNARYDTRSLVVGNTRFGIRRHMELKELQADHKARAEAVAKEMNENLAQRQALEARWKELVREADRLNGEARILNRLSKDGEQQPK
jgi:predicted nuclease with TOPRIM domain